ncbi:MAG: glycosyltransferase family 39 protein [Chloroflexi bacterium]|nr:glycosyltransferase family 39 protein [Chloroflexota bacterium]
MLKQLPTNDEGISHERKSARAVLNPCRVFIILVISYALAALAQARLDILPKHNTTGANLALAIMILASALFTAISRRVTLERWPLWQTASDPRCARPLLFAGGVLLGLMSIFGFTEQRFQPGATLAWLMGIALCLWALWDGALLQESCRSWAARLQAFLRPQITISWEKIALVSICLLGAWFRLYRLDQIPWDMGIDVPSNYFDVLRIYRGEYYIFFWENLGREGLFFYLIAIVGKLLGLSYLSIKYTSALVGIATVPALYFLARRLFGVEVGLVAATLLAVNKWHVILSRVGLRVVLMPLFAILLLYCLARALSSRRSLDFGLMGLVFGLGLYTYKGTVFLFAAMVGSITPLALLHGRDLLKSLTKGMVITIIIAVVVFVPMLRYAHDATEAYTARERRQVEYLTWNFQHADKPIPQIIIHNIWKSLAMWNFYGEGVDRYNVNQERHLGFMSSVLFILGLGYLVAHWRSGVNGAILLFLFVPLVPMLLAMAPYDAPSMFRSSAAIGPTMIGASLPLVVTWRLLKTWLASANRPEAELTLGIEERTRQQLTPLLSLSRYLLPALTIAIALVLVYEAGDTLAFYFGRYEDALPYGHNYSYARAIAKTMLDFKEGPFYLVDWPHWPNVNALKIHLAEGGLSPEWDDVIRYWDPNIPPLSNLRGKFLLIFHPEDIERMNQMRGLCKRWYTVSHWDYEGRLAFVAFYGER